MSLDKIGLSVYDFLGYIFPGFVVLFGLSIIEATFFDSDLVSLSVMADNLLFVAILAYFLGHICNALGAILKNKLTRFFKDNSHRFKKDLFDHVRSEVSETFNIKLDGREKIDTLETYMLTDAYNLAIKQAPNRDTYLAMEGFYRGAMVAFAFMAAIFLTTILTGGFYIQKSPGAVVFGNQYLASILTILSIGLTLLFRNRFLFFNRIKMNDTYLYFLALKVKEK